MKQPLSFFLFLLSTAIFASGQSVFVPAEDKPVNADGQQEIVCEGGNLIAAVNTTTVVAPTPEIYFLQGFASESSEDYLLEYVKKAITKDPEHACEIVKEAIVISSANAELVAKIVETACLAAPEKMRIIAQCAIAANPDALAEIQQILAKLDPATGDGESSKSGKETVSSKSGKEIVPARTPPPLLIRIDTPPPIFPQLPPTISPPTATNNHLR